MKTKIKEPKVIEFAQGVQLTDKAISNLQFLQNGCSDAPAKNEGLKDYQLQIKILYDFILHLADYETPSEKEIANQLNNVHQMSLLIDSFAKP